MAGSPIWKRIKAKIAAAGGVEFLCARIADGASLTELGRQFGTTRHYVYRYIKGVGGEVGLRMYAEAKKERASALVDEGLDILDAPAEDGPAVSRAKNRAEFRRWLASVANRAEYGAPDKLGPGGVTVNVQNLHLSALQAAGTPPALEAGESDVVDADVVEICESG